MWLRSVPLLGVHFPSVILPTERNSSGCHLCLSPVLSSIPTGVGGLAGFCRALEVVSHRHSCCATAVRLGHTVSAPQRKTVVRLHALSFYTRTAGRGARGENWLILLTLEGDWALWRDPISQSL